MKFSQPFEGVPLWEFSGLDIPDIDPYSYQSFSAQEKKNIMSDDIYKKRLVIDFEHLEGCPKYEKVISEIEKCILTIKAEQPDRIYTAEGEYTTLLFMMDAWNMRDYKNTEFVLDRKGFNMGYHLDNHNIKCNLFLNLKDNVSSTEFLILNNPMPWNYEEYKCVPREWKGPTNKGTGYFYFNEDRLWHKINVDDEERFIAMMGVTIE